MGGGFELGRLDENNWSEELMNSKIKIKVEAALNVELITMDQKFLKQKQIISYSWKKGNLQQSMIYIQEDRL